ncbi:MAG TPA: DinB family protein [Bryobacteraceae bacterium]
MASRAMTQETFSPALLSRWKQLNEKLLAIGNAFPEANYDCRPAERVRSFADVFRHLAFWNQYVAGSARGSNPAGGPNELSAKEYPGKKQVLGIFETTAVESAAALEQGVSAGKEELCLDFLQHSAEHYGQLVVYCRLNGIVPPASLAAE